MNALWWSRQCCAVVFALCVLIGLPTPSEAQIENAKATHVGDLPPQDADGESSVTFSAHAILDSSVDLSTSVVTATEVLDEIGIAGAGELLGAPEAPVLPLTLLPRPGSKSSNAVFTTSGSERPSVRLSVRRRSGGETQVLLKLSRAVVSRYPNLCAGDPAHTRLATTFALSDGVNPPTAVIHFSQNWECHSARLRITEPPPPAPSPTPTPVGTPVPTPPEGDEPPVARLRTDQLTRVTGQPNLVLLDGTGSSDPDGSVASYEFSVDDRNSGTPVVAPAETTDVTFEVTLPPGDYVAKLRVKDDQGAFSAPAERGFSLH
jgi:K319-like protein